MRGNGHPPAEVEYVLIPIDVDEGETETPAGLVSLTVADLDEGLTVVGVPRDLTLDQRKRLMEAIADDNKESGRPRKFVVVYGEIGSRWRFWRLVRRDRYDSEFHEERPNR